MSLLQPVVAQQLWSAQQPFSFFGLSLNTRMTVVRLGDGGLWLHSPITYNNTWRAVLEPLGEVRHLIAPNLSHHLFIDGWRQAYPHALCHFADGLERKHPGLTNCQPLSTSAALWRDDFEQYAIKGLPIIDEWVFFHRATQTLLLTDLCFCIGPNKSFLARLVATLLGIHQRVAMSRTMRLMIKDRAAFRASIAPLLDLPIQRLVLAHDSIIESGDETNAAKRSASAQQFREAMAFLDNL